MNRRIRLYNKNCMESRLKYCPQQLMVFTKKVSVTDT
uniref:Uncharacterized protein n=1 Tax=Anguilla anguilla TaxID=7936 RepID=A0A0E9T5E7_ANGAN